MWQLHIYINKAYRDLLNDRLRGQQNVITRRKVEKLYINYLKTAQAFYQGYFQRLQSAHGMPQIPRINSKQRHEKRVALSKSTPGAIFPLSYLPLGGLPLSTQMVFGPCGKPND